MGRLKTFRKYILWIVGFYILSTLLMYVGINSSYRNIKNIEGNPEQVNVEIAQATTVNRKNLWEN